MRHAVLLVLIVAFAAVSPISAQEATQEAITLTEVVPASIGKVWRAVRASMAEVECSKPQVEQKPDEAPDGGFQRASYFSDYCVLAQGEDSTKSIIKRYSEVPRIRGGIWTTFRIQYKFNMKEIEGNQTKIILRAQCSGYEEFITSETHFWNSNGVLEREMMARLLANIKKEVEASTQE